MSRETWRVCSHHQVLQSVVSFCLSGQRCLEKAKFYINTRKHNSLEDVQTHRSERVVYKCWSLPLFIQFISALHGLCSFFWGGDAWFCCLTLNATIYKYCVSQPDGDQVGRDSKAGDKGKWELLTRQDKSIHDAICPAFGNRLFVRHVQYKQRCITYIYHYFQYHPNQLSWVKCVKVNRVLQIQIVQALQIKQDSRMHGSVCLHCMLDRPSDTNTRLIGGWKQRKYCTPEETCSTAVNCFFHRSLFLPPA